MTPIRGRSLASPSQAGMTLLHGLVEDVQRLQRQQVTVDDAGRLQIGPMLLYAEQNTDDTVTVYLQNAITLGPPITLAILQ